MTGTTSITSQPPAESAGPSLGTPGPELPRLIRSELLKIRTTNVWWWFLIGLFFATGLALLTWIAVGNSQIDEAERAGSQTFQPTDPGNEFATEAERQQFELAQDLTRTLHDVTAEIYTSGQFFGLMFALLLGTLLITNEFHHQTATATFLTTPQRTRVILGKLSTAMLGAGLFWLFATVLSIVAGSIFLSIKGYGPQLGEWPVLRAILLNALAYGLWGILGIGLGVLIRSQIGAVLIGVIAYLIGTVLLQNIVIPLLYFWLEWDWILSASVAWPGIASQVMISPEEIFPGMPPWWVGTLVLVGYGVLFGVVGTMIMRRRDIS